MLDTVDSSAIIPSAALQHRRTASDMVADSLREAINAGRLADGAVLNQVEIAELFNVSRVPVREAMRLLEAEGLIEAAAHRSPVVRRLDPERVAELFELRALIEGHLVAAAVPNIDDATIERLVEINQAMRDAADHVAWLTLNGDFHRTLYAPSGKVEAIELLDTLRTRGERYVKMWSRGAGLRRNAEGAEEHDRIIAAVRARDVELARAEMAAHINRTRDEVVRLGASHIG
jgi:DNA-binding GntR family transcriptional regulator